MQLETMWTVKMMNSTSVNVAQIALWALNNMLDSIAHGSFPFSLNVMSISHLHRRSHVSVCKASPVTRCIGLFISNYLSLNTSLTVSVYLRQFSFAKAGSICSLLRREWSHGGHDVWSGLLRELVIDFRFSRIRAVRMARDMNTTLSWNVLEKYGLFASEVLNIFCTWM